MRGKIDGHENGKPVPESVRDWDLKDNSGHGKIWVRLHGRLLCLAL